LTTQSTNKIHYPIRKVIEVKNISILTTPKNDNGHTKILIKQSKKNAHHCEINTLIRFTLNLKFNNNIMLLLLLQCL